MHRIKCKRGGRVEGQKGRWKGINKQEFQEGGGEEEVKQLCDNYFYIGMDRIAVLPRDYRVGVRKIRILGVSPCVDFISTKLAADYDLPNR